MITTRKSLILLTATTLTCAINANVVSDFKHWATQTFELAKELRAENVLRTRGIDNAQCALKDKKINLSSYENIAASFKQAHNDQIQKILTPHCDQLLKHFVTTILMQEFIGIDILGRCEKIQAEKANQETKK